MIQPNELRIGNWVINSHANTDTPFQIDAFDLYDYDANDDWEWLGVPLTEEWLLKFGFEDKGKSYMGWYNYKKDNFIVIDEQNIFSFCYENIDGDDFDLEIKYLHQLQNLYFALTGEELKFE